MAPTENMPVDPLATIEESNLKRDIAAVEWQKEHNGTTWAQYLGSTIVLLGMSEFSAHEPLMWDRRQRLADLVPRLQEAERLDNRDFPSIKREVVRAVQDAMIVERELMNTPAM